jgi:hypothetical protein
MLVLARLDTVLEMVCVIKNMYQLVEEPTCLQSAAEEIMSRFSFMYILAYEDCLIYRLRCMCTVFGYCFVYVYLFFLCFCLIL